MNYYTKPVWNMDRSNSNLDNVNSIINSVLINRGFKTEKVKQNFSAWGSHYSPIAMKDLRLGCTILDKKIADRKSIRICSDYDVDGVSSAYLLYNGLSEIWSVYHEDGAKISVDIPNRVTDGYGLNVNMVEKACKDGIDTIITCDNGISSLEAVDKARELNLTIIITDHHEPITDDTGKAILPTANAIINPHQPGCLYPFKGLCGAGVVYKVLEQLYSMHNLSIDKNRDFMEILGLATCCDMMELIDENREFVAKALSYMTDSSIPAIKKLISVMGKEGKPLTTYDFGFNIGPAINAAGRMDDARIALDFLLDKKSPQLREKAQELVLLNEERKRITNEGADKLKEEILNSSLVDDKILVCNGVGLHESVCGIVASRLKEFFARPVLVMTETADGVLKGSGRSIPEYNLFENLNVHRDLFIKVGGHPLAAGFSIKKENLNTLRQVLNAECRLSKDDIVPKIEVDCSFPLDLNSFELVNSLSELEPFGNGNRKPIFMAENVTLSNFQILGKSGNTIKFTATDKTNRANTCISFDAKDILDELSGSTSDISDINNISKVFNILFFPHINEYKGARTLQLLVSDIRAS